ncbi:MAG TPA: tannase/feruloyl esterase family alpha/beta hydrolase [Rugosimonospora sp.]|nr:tannase/feruloyl esterase family alpha/beta hydrolase [Rugosimonospora sp.]
MTDAPGRRTRAAVLAAALAAVALTGGGQAAPAQATTSARTVAPVLTCPALSGVDFSGVPGAPATILSATLVPAGTNGVSYEYCDVKGVVAPQVQFELQLPTRTYLGRYLQEGCGGYCGNVGVSASPAASAGCVPLNTGTFAVGQDDEGHIGGGATDVWAIGDPQSKVDFGYRSEHVFALAAKAVQASFYGAPPAKSYYDGCSDGGREALMEAQRYPTDFNGILAGAPAQNQAALNAIEEPYEATLDFTPSGQVILPASKLTMLHAAVIAACATPGLRDGTIEDPRDCAFQPSSLQCPANVDAAGCLTTAQVDVVNKIYNGAVSRTGEHLYTGGEPKGTENLWQGILIPPDGQGQAAIFFTKIGSGYLRYVGQWVARPQATVNTNAYTVQNLLSYRDGLGRIYDATDPDLTAFYRAGGKLIQWAGWADQFIPPTTSTTYYQAVLDTMGARRVGEFYRLYMFPGVGHCGGGYGPNQFDLLTPLVDWVESGTTPSRVVASAATYSRPVYPYPTRVRYAGQGDVNSAASYVPYQPATRYDDHFAWAGAPFRSGYELWCRFDGTRMVCTARSS